jgi:hypothetical protein
MMNGRLALPGCGSPSGRGFNVRVSASAASFASDFRFRATTTTSNLM